MIASHLARAKLLGTAMLVLFTTNSARAEILFQDFSVSYLLGNDYRVGDSDRQIITFEHVVAASWGDSFLFIDHLRSDNGTRENYAEWTPRLSLCKNGILCFSNGLISDVLIASTVEMSQLSTDLLLGVGVDLDVPGFQFAQINLLRRNNKNFTDNWQLTAAWEVPFQLFGQTFQYDGFADWFNSTRDQRSSLNWTSQFKWSASEALGLSNRLFFGIEYVYWRNKFGIADSARFPTNESNVNFIAKWHF